MRLILALTAALVCTSAAAAETRSLRVLGEVEGAKPMRLVVDATITPEEDDPFKAEVNGWIALFTDEAEGAEIEGTCVEARCALSADLNGTKLALSADLAGPGAPGVGRLVVTADDGQRRETAVKFTPITGPVPGVGQIAPAGAIGARELAELLLWNGATQGFSNSDDDEIDWLQRDALAEWQTGAGRTGAGLILVEDLALLREHAVAAKRAAGWTPLSGSGWSAGYPAAVLPKAETVGDERRFSSADGRRRLVIAIDPPMNEEAWDAFVEKTTEDRPGYDTRSYTRVNDDMEISWEEKGRRVHAAYHRREGGMARLEYSTPLDDEGTDPDWTVVLPRSFKVDDGLARPEGAS